MNPTILGFIGPGSLNQVPTFVARKPNQTGKPSGPRAVANSRALEYHTLGPF